MMFMQIIPNLVLWSDDLVIVHLYVTYYYTIAHIVVSTIFDIELIEILPF